MKRNRFAPSLCTNTYKHACTPSMQLGVEGLLYKKAFLYRKGLLYKKAFDNTYTNTLTQTQKAFYTRRPSTTHTNTLHKKAFDNTYKYSGTPNMQLGAEGLLYKKAFLYRKGLLYKKAFDNTYKHAGTPNIPAFYACTQFHPGIHTTCT